MSGSLAVARCRYTRTVIDVTSTTVAVSYKAIIMNDDERIQYRSLSEAIHDVSQPDFDPGSLRVVSGPNISAHLGSTKLSSVSSMSLGRLAGSPDCPSKYPPFSPLRASSTKPEKLPLSVGFEAPEWKKILLHIALCLVSYPTLLGVVLIARNRSIFWTRFIVGVAGGFIGFSLGYSLLTFAKSHLEAANADPQFNLDNGAVLDPWRDFTRRLLLSE
ncbi:hypothetical protein C0993_004838 [Termitomyces sp. T159_Od127]|nr:hypothetical protein C0993_004838 [Termitomyces sp. T159_Od127]